MKRRHALLLALTFIAVSFLAVSFSPKSRDDDSIKYVKVGNVHLPNETCTGGWAVMINSSGHSGGPNKNIRVYYTHNNQPRVCDTRPLPQVPNPNQIYTLLGCWGGNYVITRSEYIN